MKRTCRFRYLLTIINAMTIMFLAMKVSAQGNTQIGRYLTVEPVAEMQARFPLVEVGDIAIPADVQKVRSAMGFVLAGTGYSVAPPEYLDPRSQQMLDSPVALTQRVMRKVTRLNAMAALAGPGFEVVVDPLSRRVAFDVCLHKPAHMDAKQ